jgi:hypothetical protein
MKATIEIPDDLYREFKAETAREGHTVREITILLFEQWLSQKKQRFATPLSTDWNHFQPPLAHLVPGHVTDHSAAAMRKSINSQWNEPS